MQMQENEVHIYSYDSAQFENERINISNQDLAKNALFQIQGRHNINKIPIKSVSTLSAQITGLCESRKYRVLFQAVNRLLDCSNSELSSYEKAILELQFLYGLRISEVLSITYSDVNFNGSINVKGLKGSLDRLVYPVKMRDYWLFMLEKKIIIPESFNRFYFYRLYKKKGIFEVVSSNAKKSVTHILRYNFIVNLLKSGKNIEEIQQLLGHKSIKSTLHYVENLLK